MTAAQNVVADRNFAICEVRAHALVDAFIASADKHQPFERDQFLCKALIELAPLRRKQNYGLACPAADALFARRDA